MPLGTVQLNARNHNNGGGNSSRVSSSEEMVSTLRHRRELRYSRDQEALSTSLSCCTAEPSLKQLQIVALERVKKELEARSEEHQQRIHLLRDRLASQNAPGDQSRDFFLRQRLLEEHRLAAARKEETVVTEQLAQLRWERCSPTMGPADCSRLYSERALRTNANLSLFLEKSATKRPLPTPSRPLSADSLQKSDVSRVRNSASCAFRGQHNRSHMRSRSLIEDSQVDKLHVEEAQQTELSSPSSCLKAALPSERHFPYVDLIVPAVDEFNNSFSSRVIAPPHPRSKRVSSLRSLRTSTRERRSLFLNDSTKLLAGNLEYGNVTIIPHTKPRSKSDLLENLPGVPLPTYVQNLMDDFEQTSQPPLALGLSEHRIPETPALRKPMPLSPVLEQPSTPLSFIKGQPSSNSSGRKPTRKQRSIFTLRLPLRPSVPGSASRSTLAASSSTSEVESADGHPLPARLAEPSIPLRPKGLPSTRNYDLSILDRAPDDVPESPIYYQPSSPIPVRSRTSRSFAVLRDVKSKLVQLGRR